MNEKEFKVLFELYRSKKPIYFRDIVKRTDLAYGTVQGIINKNKSLFNICIEGKNKYFSLKDNIDNKYLFYQLEMERTRTFIIKNPKLRPFVEKISQLNIPALVFGSFAKGTANKDSDLDLLIISSEKDIPDQLCPYKIHKIFIDQKNIGNLKKEALYEEIMKDHVIISGFDLFMTEVFR